MFAAMLQDILARSLASQPTLSAAEHATAAVAIGKARLPLTTAAFAFVILAVADQVATAPAGISAVITVLVTRVARAA